MTKTIINIIQNDSGGTNPDTHAHEDKVWELQFEDEDSAVLTKGKMLEYLTKGTVPIKTVHSFKKWDIITTLGHTIRTWVVVYDDKSHVQLTNKDFYSLMTNGHEKKDEEKEEAEGQRGPVSTAIAQAQQQAQEEAQPSITTSEERKKVDEFRNQIKEEKLKEDFLEEVRKDYYASPDSKGLADVK